MNTETVWEWLPTLTGWALKSLVVFALCGLTLLALRRASASARHLVCLLTLAGLLALPILSLALPGWRLAMQLPGEPTPAHQFATPPVSGGGRVSDKRPMADAVLTSPSSRIRKLPSAARLASPAPPELGAGGAASPHPFPWIALLSALWFLGFVAALLRPLLGLWGIACLSRTSQIATDTSTLALAAECAWALNLTQKPLLRQADAPVPMTWGDRQPVILLPAEAQAWPQDRLHAVLLHEMAHIRRRDWLSHRFSDIVCALYWFHPLVWLTARRLRAESEIACDDLVLTSGITAPDYARHLLAVARTLRPASAALPRTAIAMARTFRIEGRLKMILDSAHSRSTPSRHTLLLALGLSVAMLVLLAIVRPTAQAQGTRIAPAVASLPVSARTTHSQSFPILPAPVRITPLNRVKHTVAPVRIAQLPKTALPVASLAPQKHLYSLPVRLMTPHYSGATASLNTAPLVSASDFRENGVLLAGMANGTDLGSRWWGANGDLLPQDIYDTKVYPAESHAFSPSTKNVIFAFRLSPTAESATVRYEVPDSLGASSMGSWPFKLQSQKHLTEAQFDLRTGGTRILTAAFPPTLSHTTLRVGFASGAWKTLATDTLSGPDGYGSTDIKEGNSKFLFGPALETKTDVVLTISTDTTDDLRVVAVDAQGRESLPTQIGDTGYTTLDQITAHFAQPLAKIKEIRVQTRPFRWVEFKDVALQPVK